MKKIFFILLITFSFSFEIYKEIKISNLPSSTIPFLSSIGVDLDHIYKQKDFIQFVISAYDLNKLDYYNVDYEIIHEDIQSFYASRLSNSYESRDFDLGSMGGYYTFSEIR